MKRIDLKTGFLCNNNCLFCVQAHKKKFGNKNTAELKSCLSQAAKEGYQSVVFTGGESTIRPDIIDLVKYAKTSGFKVVQMQSNGRRFANLDFCKEIIEAGANQFSPALHGHNSKIHDYLTQVDGAFNQTVKGILNLKKLNQGIFTNTVITQTNYRYLPQIARLLLKLKVDQMQFAFVHAMGNAWKNFDSVVPRKSLVAPYVKRALNLSINSGVVAMTEAIPYCFMAGYENFISEERIPDTKILDLDSVVENFNEKRKSDSKIKTDKCQTCKYFEKCEGPWKEYPEHFGWNEFKPVN